MILTIRNDGPEIIETNYWDTDAGRSGALYLSTNAGAFRLLVPNGSIGRVLTEIVNARGAAVSRGPWPSLGIDDAIEVLLDDESDSPWSCQLSLGSVDRLPLDADVGRVITLSVWTHGFDDKPRKRLQVPCTYRRSAKLPDLRPWREV